MMPPPQQGTTAPWLVGQWGCPPKNRLPLLAEPDPRECATRMAPGPGKATDANISALAKKNEVTANTSTPPPPRPVGFWRVEREPPKEANLTQTQVKYICVSVSLKGTGRRFSERIGLSPFGQTNLVHVGSNED